MTYLFTKTVNAAFVQTSMTSPLLCTLVLQKRCRVVWLHCHACAFGCLWEGQDGHWWHGCGSSHGTDFIDSHDNFKLRFVLFCSVVFCWSCDSPALSRPRMMPHGSSALFAPIWMVCVLWGHVEEDAWLEGLWRWVWTWVVLCMENGKVFVECLFALLLLLSLQLLVFALCCVPGTPGSCMCFRFCPRPYRVGCLCADLIVCDVCSALSFVCVWVYVCACSENGRCCMLVWSMFGMWICLYVTSMYKAIGWFCGCSVPCRLGLLAWVMCYGVSYYCLYLLVINIVLVAFWHVQSDTFVRWRADWSLMFLWQEEALRLKMSQSVPSRWLHLWGFWHAQHGRIFLWVHMQLCVCIFFVGCSCGACTCLYRCMVCAHNIFSASYMCISKHVLELQLSLLESVQRFALVFQRIQWHLLQKSTFVRLIRNSMKLSLLQGLPRLVEFRCCNASYLVKSLMRIWLVSEIPWAVTCSSFLLWGLCC